jgi:organic radical activating enzyme
MVDIRSGMLAGEKVPACNACYEAEMNTKFSKRVVDSMKYIRSHDVEPKLVMEDPLSYDIRHTNLCNLKCRMCECKDSTALNSEVLSIGKDIFPYQKPVNYHNGSLSSMVRSIARNDNVKDVYLAGGEPSIDPDMIKMIADLADKDVVLTVVTNGQEFSDRFIDTLSHIKKLHMTFSLDGISRVNNYIRWPGDLDKAIDNINRVCLIPGCEVSINMTLQAINMFYLSESIEFFKKHLPGVNLLLNEVDEPKMLSVAVIPPALRLKISEKLENLTDTLPYLNFRIRYLLDKMNSTRYDPNLHQHFVRYNQLLDSHRKISWKDHVSELTELFEIDIAKSA